MHDKQSRKCDVCVESKITKKVCHCRKKNMTLKEMMNAILISSNAPDNLWGEALLTTCFLQNRISYKKTGKTPYELWKGFQPNLKYLRLWGCLAKVMLPDPKKRKIGSKTSGCLFLGYAEQIGRASCRERV